MGRLLAYHLVDTQTLDLTANPVDNSAWVQIVSSTPKPCSAAEVYNGSNSLLMLAVGSPGSEVAIPYTVLPGRTVLIPFEVSKGQRISAKAATATVSNTDYLALNLMG